MLRDYLACSGWTAAFTETGIVTAGKADSFLKTSHLTMQNILCAPTYLLRAHHEKDFPLYVEALEAIVFVFDHYNYARWVPIHILDMLSIPDSIKENFMRYWVVSKTKNRFSSIPIDQMHEQENAKVRV